MNPDRGNPLADELPDEINRGLNRVFGVERDRLAPSSGFAAKVMESVRDDTATPEPLPFPWKRALLTFGAAFAILLCGLVRYFDELRRLPPPEPSAVPPHLAAALAGAAIPLGWLALALLVALLSVTLCLRLAAPRT